MARSVFSSLVRTPEMECRAVPTVLGSGRSGPSGVQQWPDPSASEGTHNWHDMDSPLSARRGRTDP